MTRTDKLTMWIAYRLPRRVVYWCFIRLMADVTTGPLSDRAVPEIEAMEALKAWDAA